ncbi:hypothetical protein F5883DRAFT_657561 [Diaporthe sp. PMI_573]|jgi:hypothetical protein|nr:hypothetical protein F5883DRAFT_657561 [Diaporthaceae sp. PMI_573]
MEEELTPTPTRAATPTPTPPSNQPSTVSINISFALERKLVTLRKITQIRRPCSLRFKCLVVATVSPGGYEVVIRKGNWDVGDHVLFFEVDSFIPAACLKIGWLNRHRLTTFDGDKGYYVQSRMVGKQMSRGYIMAISDHPIVLRIVNIMKEEYGPVEGLRVASMMAFEDVMGVKKWEPRA